MVRTKNTNVARITVRAEGIMKVVEGAPGSSSCKYKGKKGKGARWGTKKKHWPLRQVSFDWLG